MTNLQYSQEMLVATLVLALALGIIIVLYIIGHRLRKKNNNLQEDVEDYKKDASKMSRMFYEEQEKVINLKQAIKDSRDLEKKLIQELEIAKEKIAHLESQSEGDNSKEVKEKPPVKKSYKPKPKKKPSDNQS